MEKLILAAANHFSKQYYIAEEFKALPYYVQKELKGLCVKEAERLCGVFQIGFYENGNLYLNVTRSDGGSNAPDDSVSRDMDIEFKRVNQENDRLFEGLRLWYLTVCKK